MTEKKVELGDGEPSPPPTNDQLDEQFFYELMQAYRHAPLADMNGTVGAFESVKKYVRANWIYRGAAQEVSLSASEIRADDPPPSCHVCGARMVVKEWKCLSCKATTGVEVSPPSPRETDGHPVGWCCKHCYDGGYQAAMRLQAEGDTRELKAAIEFKIADCCQKAERTLREILSNGRRQP